MGNYMKRVSHYFAVALLACVLLSTHGLAVVFKDTAGDHSWDTARNWHTGAAPLPTEPILMDQSGAVLEIGAGENRTITTMWLGDNNAIAFMTVTGGTFNAGYFNISLGQNAEYNEGHLLVSGGALNVHDLNVPRHFSSATVVSKATVKHYGGTIDVANNFHMGNGLAGNNGGDGEYDMRQGATLIIDGNEEAEVNGYVASGYMTAYEGLGTLHVDYDISNAGKTTVTASPPASVSAVTVTGPADSSTVTREMPWLEWSSVPGATGYNIYIGTSLAAISVATTASAEFVGNQPDTFHEASGLDGNKVTYYWRVDAVTDGYVAGGAVRSFTLEALPTASHPSPADGEEYITSGNGTVSWTGHVNATSYDVYFGADRSAVLNATGGSPEFRGNQAETTYSPADIDFNRVTYFWRIDAVSGFTTNKGTVWQYRTSPKPGPPYTDYNAFIQHDIQDSKHSFMAGNRVYYMGGGNGNWDGANDPETIGLTRPIFHDARTRGIPKKAGALVAAEMESGWEWHKFARVAYGSVIIDGVEYTEPRPLKMVFRPDRVVCEYNVGGVTLREEKFISYGEVYRDNDGDGDVDYDDSFAGSGYADDGDVAITRITSSRPVTLRFRGQSWWSDTWSASSTASLTVDTANNLIQITEGGTSDAFASPAPIMYDGMTTIIKPSRTYSNTSQSSDANNQQFYAFDVPCDPDGVDLAWTMHDSAAEAKRKVGAVLADVAAKMSEKSRVLNAELNYQIPYFRCDTAAPAEGERLEKIYYYLWAIDLMYYTFPNSGFTEGQWYTQVAVNNFMTYHQMESRWWSHVGSWAVNKDKYAFGMLRIYDKMIDHLDTIDDTAWYTPYNFGTDWWFSEMSVGMGGFAEPVLQNYHHSGDIGFLGDAYTNVLARIALRRGQPGHNDQKHGEGAAYEAMESHLGIDLADWLDLVGDEASWSGTFPLTQSDAFPGSFWERDSNYAYAGGSDYVRIGAFRKSRQWWFPELWAAQQSEYWIADDVRGFMGDHAAIKTISRQNESGNDTQAVDNGPFDYTPDTAYWTIMSMFDKSVGLNAADVAKRHLLTYNWRESKNEPVAPESMDEPEATWTIPEHALDQYSNFGGGKTRYFLEGFAGISYSVVDDIFVVKDSMPDDWTNMTVMVPITDVSGGHPAQIADRWQDVDWVTVNYEMSDPLANGNLQKTITVTNNPLGNLRVLPFLQERKPYDAEWTPIDPSLVGTYPAPKNSYRPYDDFVDYDAYTPPGYLKYDAGDPTGFSITLNMEDAEGPTDGTAEWQQDPVLRADDPTKVDMAASIAWDKDDVDYEFDYMQGDELDTNQSSPFYTADLSLISFTNPVSFRVRPVDLQGNQGEWSEIRWVFPPATAVLYDDFDDNSIDAGKWTASDAGEVVESGQVLNMTSSGPDRYLTCEESWDLTANFSFIFDFATTTPTGSHHDKEIRFNGDGWHVYLNLEGCCSFFKFGLNDGARKQVSTVSNPITSGGALRIEYTPVGETWYAYYSDDNQATWNLIATLTSAGYSKTLGVTPEFNVDNNGAAVDIAIDDVKIGGYKLGMAPEENQPPYATAVTVAGTPTSGQVLTGNYTYNDAELDIELGTTFQWYRSADSTFDGADVAIAGATASTYTLTAADVGFWVFFEVSPRSDTWQDEGSPVQHTIGAQIGTGPGDSRGSMFKFR